MHQFSCAFAANNLSLSLFLNHLKDTVHKARVSCVHEARDPSRPLSGPKGARAHEDIEAGGQSPAQREAGHVLRHKLGQRHVGVMMSTWVKTLSEMYNINAYKGHTRIMISREY